MKVRQVKVLIEKGSLIFINQDDGSIQFPGKTQIKRASHVEPDENNQWWSDMSPCNGPKIGPFKTRGQALVAEVAWINKNVLTVK